MGALSDDPCLTSVAYVGPKSRTERPRKTKIGTEVAHITRDSDTTFEVKGQGHQAALVGCSSHDANSLCAAARSHHLHGAGAYCGGLPHSLLLVLNSHVHVPGFVVFWLVSMVRRL